MYNLDENGVTTVQAPGRVVTAKGKKQVAAATSQEKGDLSTLCCAINAGETFIPPFIIFPRVYMRDCFMEGTPPGSLGVAHKTGYMNRDLFCEK